MSDEQALEWIGGRLDMIIGLLAAGLASRIADAGGKQVDQIVALSRAGLDRQTIARVLGTTPNTVSVALSSSAKKKKKTRGRAPKGGD